MRGRNDETQYEYPSRRDSRGDGPFDVSRFRGAVMLLKVISMTASGWILVAQMTNDSPRAPELRGWNLQCVCGFRVYNAKDNCPMCGDIMPHQIKTRMRDAETSAIIS